MLARRPAGSPCTISSGANTPRLLGVRETVGKHPGALASASAFPVWLFACHNGQAKRSIRKNRTRVGPVNPQSIVEGAIGRQSRGHCSDRTRGRGHEAHQGHRRANSGALSTRWAPLTARGASAREASSNSVGPRGLFTNGSVACLLTSWHGLCLFS